MKTVSEDYFKQVVEKWLPVIKDTFGIPTIAVYFLSEGNNAFRRGPFVRITKNAIEFLANDQNLTIEDAVLRILLHEALHIKGLEHDRRARQLSYYSSGSRDYFTMAVADALKQTDEKVLASAKYAIKWLMNGREQPDYGEI